MGEKNQKNSVSATFKTGAVSLAFLIIGYQASLFIHRAAVLRAGVARDHPDTVYVVDEDLARRVLGLDGTDLPQRRNEDSQRRNEDGQRQLPQRRNGPAGGNTPPDRQFTQQPPGRRDVTQQQPAGGISVKQTEKGYEVRHDAVHAQAIRTARNATRKVESFRFDPNTVSLEDLQRLGFSEKQALSIVNYREKGGRFRRKSDFAKSYVVADSVFRRLESYIDIPKVDINKADSAAFDSLPGIGGYFASKMVSYRESLGGYSYPEQLMDIYHFDEEKFRALEDLIVCGEPEREFDLWNLPAEELRLHPYVRSFQTAKAIVFYKKNSPPEEWTVENLGKAGILSAENTAKLSRCRIKDP